MHDLTFISQLVSESFEISEADLLGRSRANKFAFPRHVAIYLMKRFTGHTNRSIGEFVGGRDPSCGQFSAKSVREYLDVYENGHTKIINRLIWMLSQSGCGGDGTAVPEGEVAITINVLPKCE